MKDYFPVSMPRYSRYRQRLRASRTVRFPNDVVFQDHIRQGDLEQVGRFIRARKVALDTIYPSGECCWGWQWHGSVDCKGDERAAWPKLRHGPPWAGQQVEIKLFSLPSEEHYPLPLPAGPKSGFTAPTPPLTALQERGRFAIRVPSRHDSAPTPTRCGVA